MSEPGRPALAAVRANASLRQRLFVWLAASILLAGLLAAVLSFILSFRDANDLQDTQLQQVAAVLATDAQLALPLKFKPRDEEDAETHFVVDWLGSAGAGPGAAADADPQLDLPLPPTLPPGLQTLTQSEVRWRAIVTRDPAGRRFAVAQRMTVRDEVARDAALMTLLPLLVLIPLLLVIVGIVLRQVFAPMTAMSAIVDRQGVHQFVALDEGQVPLESLPLVQAFNRLSRRLTLALDQQRRLVADAAHELRTPVAALLVQADNVERVELSPDARSRMASLRLGLTRMASLLDQLLSFARVQGAAPEGVQVLDLNALVRTAIEESLSMAQVKGVDLGCVRMDIASIRGDQLHAYALIRNAVDNAVRYAPPRGAVDVSVSVEGGQATFVVEDTGPGIAESDIARVFEPFVRVLGRQESGSGLGLAIARTAAEALGGRIELGPRADRRSGLRFVYRQATV